MPKLLKREQSHRAIRDSLDRRASERVTAVHKRIDPCGEETKAPGKRHPVKAVQKRIDPCGEETKAPGKRIDPRGRS